MTFTEYQPVQMAAAGHIGRPRRLRVALMATIVEYGGIERVLLTLLQHMHPAVEFVPLLYTRTDTKVKVFFEQLAAQGIRHNIMYVNVDRPKYLNPLKNIAQTIRILRKQRVDLIHSHGYRADIIAFPVSKYTGLPVVSTCHGFISNDLNMSLYNRLDVFLLRYFARVVAVSAPMRQQLAVKGVGAAKIDVITNPVNTTPEPEAIARARRTARARLLISDDEFVFGFVGRVSEEKGLHHLVKAVRGFSSTHTPWRLIVVGDGAKKTALEQSVRELHLTDRITFVGFQPDPSAWYPAMDAFVLPSLTEGTPLALLEAMSYRLPVIATAVGGVPAIITDRENGLLVPAGDPVTLLGAMRAVMSDGSLSRQLGDAALLTVRQTYDVESWIRKIHDVYLSTAETCRSTQ